jgi:post-segregation antitoxin (ccd killing protein)
MVPMTVKVDPSTRAELEQVAKDRKISVADLVRLSIVREIARHRTGQ